MSDQSGLYFVFMCCMRSTREAERAAELGHLQEESSRTRSALEYNWIRFPPKIAGMFCMSTVPARYTQCGVTKTWMPPKLTTASLFVMVSMTSFKACGYYVQHMPCTPPTRIQQQVCYV